MFAFLDEVNRATVLMLMTHLDYLEVFPSFFIRRYFRKSLPDIDRDYLSYGEAVIINTKERYCTVLGNPNAPRHQF